MLTLKKALAVAAVVPVVFAATVAQAETFDVHGTDQLKFSVEEMSVAPGEEVTIKLTNDSEMPASAMSHNLVVLDKDADADAFDQAAQGAKDDDYIPSDKKDEIIAHTALVGGGDSDSITFKAPDEPGDYTYLCTFPGHYAAGMKGVLKVEDES